jgi:hypothetical protein
MAPPERPRIRSNGGNALILALGKDIGGLGNSKP